MVAAVFRCDPCRTLAGRLPLHPRLPPHPHRARPPQQPRRPPAGRLPRVRLLAPARRGPPRHRRPRRTQIRFRGTEYLLSREAAMDEQAEGLAEAGCRRKDLRKDLQSTR
uniref:Uncharacterized protein n=1 Tax=Arundo donax TaxID=35708 RepID=A0A0A9DXS1_ARUDO